MILYINCCARTDSRTKRLAQDYFGIREVVLIKAEMLDIVGNDAEKIIQDAMEQYQLN